MFGGNRISTGQKWTRARFKTKTAGNWWEKAKPSWTPTPRLHVVNAKYAGKYHETYGVGCKTNKQKLKSLTVFYFEPCTCNFSCAIPISDVQILTVCRAWWACYKLVQYLIVPVVHSITLLYQI